MSTAKPLPELLTQLEKDVDRLQHVPFGELILTEVERILNALPDPAAVPTAQDKVRVFLLRGKTQLLLPKFIKEVEVDLNRALKLNQSNPDVWVALAESLMRRNAMKEARDAIETALRHAPKHVDALVKASQILRFQFNAEKGMKTEDRIQLLNDSMVRAKEAVATDMNRSDCWAALGMSYLQLSIIQDMSMDLAKKSLKAYNQAEAKMNPDCPDPDLFFNRAVVLRTFGEFSKAATDFQRAYEIDPKGLPQAKVMAESALNILRTAGNYLAKQYGGLPEAEFTKTVKSKLKVGVDAERKVEFVSFSTVRTPAGADSKGARWVQAKVLGLVSSETEQPLVYHCLDVEGSQALLMVYRVLPKAIKKDDLVWIPFPPSSFAVVDTGVPRSGGQSEVAETAASDGKKDAAPDAAQESKNYQTMIIAVEPRMLVVNGGEILRQYFSTPEVNSRIFQ
jgi:tetratricopeptide (TPR) repeat protein